MDMAVVITQCLLLPTLPHLRPAKCRYSAGRRPTTSEECQGWHQAGLAREINTNTPEEKSFKLGYFVITHTLTVNGFTLLYVILDRQVLAQSFYLGK